MAGGGDVFWMIVIWDMKAMVPPPPGSDGESGAC